MTGFVFPTVTVVTPVYNGAKYLPALIESVKNQQYSNIEHIIIDDGSDDDGATVKILQAYPHLRWWTHENSGQYATMNEGLQSANGDIICFISADDLMDTNAISRAVNYLSNHANHDGVYGLYQIIHANGTAHWYQPLVRCAPIIWYRYNPFIAHCSLYLRKESIISKNLLFNPSYRFTGDYEWIIRLINARLKIGCISESLSQIRWHEEQTSNTKSGPIKQEMLTIWKNNNINPLIYKLINVGIDRLIVFLNLIFSVTDQQKRKTISIWLNQRKSR